MNIKSLPVRQARKDKLFALIGENNNDSPSNSRRSPSPPHERSSDHSTQKPGLSSLQKSSSHSSISAEHDWQWALEKGDIMIVRTELGLVFTRYTGVHSVGYKSFSVWTDTSETLVENVPWVDVFLLTPHIKKVILSRDPEAVQKLVNDPICIYIDAGVLRKKVKQMMYEYLNAQGVDVALLVSVEDSSVAYMCDLVQLAKLSRQIEEIIQSKPTQLYDLVAKKIGTKTSKYLSEFGRLIYVPCSAKTQKDLIEFTGNISLIAQKHLQTFQRTTKDVFVTICRSYLNGSKMEVLNDWILIHCENSVTQYLEDIVHYDFGVLPENYLVEPPSSLPAVKENITKLEVLLRNKPNMKAIVEEVCRDIKQHVYNFFVRCYIALSNELSLPYTNLPFDETLAIDIKTSTDSTTSSSSIFTNGSSLNCSADSTATATTSAGSAPPSAPSSPDINVQNSTRLVYEKLCELVHTKSPAAALTAEKKRLLEETVASWKVLLDMTEEKPSRAPRNVNDVSYGGLVVSPIVRYLEEAKTSYDHWEIKAVEAGESQPHHIITSFTMVLAGSSNSTMLYEAVSDNKSHRVDDILGDGKYDINYQNQHGWLAAVSPNFHDNFRLLAILEMLRIKGASAYQQNNQHELPIHIACIYGNSTVIEFLLKAGSDVNAVTKSNKTCLHLAIEHRQLPVVKLLLSYGANPLLNTGIETPEQFARNMNLPEFVDVIQKHNALMNGTGSTG